MSAIVIRAGRRHLVQVILEPDEAENIAFALGLEDMGARELFDLANEARALDEADR